MKKRTLAKPPSRLADQNSNGVEEKNERKVTGDKSKYIDLLSIILVTRGLKFLATLALILSRETVCVFYHRQFNNVGLGYQYLTLILHTIHDDADR